jgi:hypothetical protein
MLATWDFYYRRYGVLLHELASRDFDLAVISEGFDWAPAKSRILEGYRGLGVEPPPKSEFEAIIDKARQEGHAAATQALNEIYGDSGPSGRFVTPCGGALMILDVDGRSHLGRFLKGAVNEVEGVSIGDYRGEGLTIHIDDMHSGQERAVFVRACEAAMAVLRERLKIDGFVEAYYT